MGGWGNDMSEPTGGEAFRVCPLRVRVGLHGARWADAFWASGGNGPVLQECVDVV